MRKTAKQRANSPPGPKSHIWQRVAFESCKHLAYGEKCGEFTTQHTDDFEEFKGTLLPLPSRLRQVNARLWLAGARNCPKPAALALYA